MEKSNYSNFYMNLDQPNPIKVRIKLDEKIDIIKNNDSISLKKRKTNLVV